MVTALLTTVLGVVLVAQPLRAVPLPPFEQWQQVALAPDDWEPGTEIILDQPGAEDSAYGRGMWRIVGLGAVTVVIWDGDRMSPTEALQHYDTLDRLGIGRSPIPGAEVPPELGTDAISVAHAADILGRESITVRLAWRYDGWTLVMSVADAAPADAVRTLATRLTLRQQEKLTAAFPTKTGP
ncbi:MAG: hypothetical protein ACRDJE_29450 [Dehalococcoidia bacterium]